MAKTTDTGPRSYRIVEVLGKGGFGTVYKATMESGGGFSKEVAIKILNEDMLGSEEVVSRLRDEARMLGLIRHRAIVQVDGLVKLNGRWAVVMEYVDGLSLGQILHGIKEDAKDGAQRTLPIGVALEIVEEVAAALDVAYSKPARGGEPLRLLHRDIKPSNIQLTAAGEAKLLDFGIARAEFGSREAETRSLIFGSVPYMAPERMAFEDSHKGDVYSLGSTLYEVLVGEPLGQAHVHPKKHTTKVKETIERLRQTITDNEDFLNMVAAMLDYEPDERPSARELERTLRELRRQFPGPWLRDWAEKELPPLLATREVSTDDWTDSMLMEQGTGEVTPNIEAQAKPKSRVERTKRSKGGGFLRALAWTSAGISTAGILAILLVVVFFVVCTVACCNSTLWAESQVPGQIEDITNMRDEIALWDDDPSTQEAHRILDALEMEVYELEIGIMEMVSFTQHFEDATADGKLTTNELKQMRRILKDISGSPSAEESY